jgi:hypothetical protein
VVRPTARHEIRRVAWRAAALELHDVMDTVSEQAALLAVFDELALLLGRMDGTAGLAGRGPVGQRGSAQRRYGTSPRSPLYGK